jgi:GT2 family glycosyltransferase
VESNDSFAVVVISYDHAETLPACLEAVSHLDPPPEHLVVVDNASEDDSAGITAAFEAPFPVSLIREDRNTGFAAAANRGVRSTRTPWVLLLNPDCAPRTDCVAEMLRTAAGSADADRIGTLSPKLVRANGPDLEATMVIDAAGMIVTPSGRHHDRGSGETDRGEYDRPAWVFGGTGAAALYRRSALEDVAYPGEEIFAESFFAYREDAELAWRLQSRSWRCLYVPSAVAAHRRGFRPEAGRTGHEAINQWSVRNRFLLRWHCADLGWHLRCLPWWLIRDVLVIGACLTIEWASLPGLLQAWTLRDDANRRRRWVLGRQTEPSRRIALWFRRCGWVEEVSAT